IEQGDNDRALAEYDAMVNKYPDVVDSYMLRAFFHLENKAYAKALADIDRALAIEPDNPVILESRKNVMTEMRGNDMKKLMRRKKHK
ncbi:MAG TPA: tetratricopeptide repeat protein, partial [Aggregatilineales bacterium]|nr:tetratricopeptide repeat protein [Aggregatilineales bacterium]